MFGFIRKSKVLKIIEGGEAQLQAKQLEVIEGKYPCTNDEYKKSIYKFEGGIIALNGLKKHFK